MTDNTLISETTEEWEARTTAEALRERNDKLRAAIKIFEFFLDHPELQAPDTDITVYTWGDNLEKAKEIARALRTFEKTEVGDYLYLTKSFGAAKLKFCLYREKICVRRVIGTETRMVTDPKAPKVEREVEIVEWDCPPSLLAPDEPASDELIKETSDE